LKDAAAPSHSPEAASAKEEEEERVVVGGGAAACVRVEECLVRRCAVVGDTRAAGRQSEGFKASMMASLTGCVL